MVSRPKVGTSEAKSTSAFFHGPIKCEAFYRTSPIKSLCDFMGWGKMHVPKRNSPKCFCARNFRASLFRIGGSGGLFCSTRGRIYDIILCYNRA